MAGIIFDICIFVFEFCICGDICKIAQIEKVAGQEEPGKLGLACGWLRALAREITDWPDPGQPFC